MLKLSQIALLLTAIVLHVHAKTEGELKLYFIELGVECAKTHRITPEEAESLHRHVLPNTEIAKCFLACLYRKANWLDDKGMYNVKGAHELADRDVEKNKIENSKKLFDLCESVNDEAVSDEDKGCERSGLLFTCLTQNAEKFGFKIQ